jgi:gluconolactonase
MPRSIWEIKKVFQGLDHPEGLNFGPDGMLYAGGEAGQIYRMDVANNVCTEIANTCGFILGVAADAVNDVYACDCLNHCVWRVSGHSLHKFVHAIEDEEPINFPNYGIFDDDGNYYVTDSGNYWRPTGRLIRVTPQGLARCLLRGLSFPNGLALSADGRTLFMVESATHRVLSVSVEGGTLGVPEIYVETPGCVPDGIALDIEGNLYISCFTPEAIFKVTTNRTMEVLVQDPTAEILNRPTNVAFTPDGSGRLYISNFGSSNISMLDLGIPGQKLRYPSWGL